MDLDTNATIDETEIDELGIKKKDDDEEDTDGEVESVDPGLLEDEEKETTDKGTFGDDPELEEYMAQNGFDAY